MAAPATRDGSLNSWRASEGGPISDLDSMRKRLASNGSATGEMEPLLASMDLASSIPVFVDMGNGVFRRKARGLRTFNVQRLLAFTDAMYAIIATILAIPLYFTAAQAQRLKEAEDSHQIIMLKVQHATFVFVSLNLVCYYWVKHVRLLEHVRKVDGLTIGLNFLSLLCIGVYPFTSTTAFDATEAGHATATNAGLFVINSIVLSLVDLCLAVSVFWRRKALVKGSRPAYMRYFVMVSGGEVLVHGIILVVGVWGVGFPYAFWGYLLMLPLLALSSTMFTIGMPELAAQLRVLNGERLETLCDGVFAMSATLIVLDIEPENFKSFADVFHTDGRDLLGYAVAFSLNALLWIAQFIHHRSIDEYQPSFFCWVTIEKMIFVSMFPAASGFIVNFPDDANVIRFATTILLTPWILYVATLFFARHSPGMMSEAQEAEVARTRRWLIALALGGVPLACAAMIVMSYINPKAAVYMVLLPAVTVPAMGVFRFCLCPTPDRSHDGDGGSLRSRSSTE